MNKGCIANFEKEEFVDGGGSHVDVHWSEHYTGQIKFGSVISRSLPAASITYFQHN